MIQLKALTAESVLPELFVIELVALKNQGVIYGKLWSKFLMHH